MSRSLPCLCSRPSPRRRTLLAPLRYSQLRRRDDDDDDAARDTTDNKMRTAGGSHRAGAGGRLGSRPGQPEASSRRVFHSTRDLDFSELRALFHSRPVQWSIGQRSLFFSFCEQQGAAACGRARQRSNRCRLARLRAVMDRGVPRGQPTGQAGWWANARRQWFGCLVIIEDFHAVGETEAGFGAALISHGAPVSSR